MVRWSPGRLAISRKPNSAIGRTPGIAPRLSASRAFPIPQWLNKIHDRLIRSVRALHPYRPLYYSLGDETGIGDLAAFWDFDLSDFSLAAMREWLKSDL